jgi:hypothetical protein
MFMYTFKSVLIIKCQFSLTTGLILYIKCENLPISHERETSFFARVTLYFFCDCLNGRQSKGGLTF